MVKPVGPLMWEHRIIEHILPLILGQVEHIDESGEVDVAFIEKATDFFRVYADRTHHGKEEDILFKELEAKKLLMDDHRRIMRELMEDHVQARSMVKRLVSAREDWINGDGEAIGVIREMLIGLYKLYPTHIEKEDRRFFIPVMEYFTEEEQSSMLEDFYMFDRGMIHWKYRSQLKDLGGDALDVQHIRAGASSHVCAICGYVYSPERGDPGHGVKPGNEFRALPEDWVCPVCFAPKGQFIMVEGRA